MSAADVLLDAGRLWSTVEIPDVEPLLRVVPTAGGMASGVAWELPVGIGTGAVLVALLRDRPATPRVHRLVELVVCAQRLAAGPLVPALTEGGWRWRAAPAPEGAVDVRAVVSAAAATGLAIEGGEQACAALLDELLAAAVGAPRDLPESVVTRPSGVSRTPGELRRWGDRVVSRRAANARLALRLDPPQGDDEDTWWLTPLAVALDADTTRVPAAGAEPSTFGTTGELLASWRTAEATALARAWPECPVVLTVTDAPLQVVDVLELLDQRLDALVASGIDVVAPGGLLRGAAVRRRATASSGGTSAGLGLQSLMLDVHVEVEGEQLTATELAELVAAKSELVAVRGRWVRLGGAERARLSRLLSRSRRSLTVADLLADEELDDVEVELPESPAWERLSRGTRVTVPETVRAELRPYQREGLDWLTWLEHNGTGGVLADDMGLGKTLQVLTRIAADHSGPTLVVCPLTLVDTWIRQAATFVPNLTVSAYHGADREDLTTLASRSDVVVTTYGLLARDDRLTTYEWFRVVLDEAQAVKNPGTGAARAARQLRSRHRLAVTGTPVENHLGDLWSLMAFATPGLLPRNQQFRRRYVSSTPDDEALARLRAVTSPFLLRRTKADPGVISDLPDRTVVRDDCSLTREQLGAYEAAVRAMLSDVAVAGMQRRGAVLSGIARLKQVCVHPALITERRTSLGGRSGKVERLVELCREIVDERQAVVVFTQFASFAPALAAHLAQQLGADVLTLTGSDSRGRRAQVVERFGQDDGPPVLVASLKAGGTGLTLVRANHVVHLDRWWNPAVEDQASDRVWRIGQKQKVVVHTLVCPGTLEERIDAVLASKRGVASSVVRSTERAVTELTDDELASLVGLAHERVLS